MQFPKTYRANVGWALSIGSLIALVANLKNDQRAVVALTVLGATGLLWSAWEHQWIRWRLKSIPIIVLIVGCFGSIGWFAWPSRQDLHAQKPPEPGLSFTVHPRFISNGEIPYGLGSWLVREPNVMFPVGIRMFLKLGSNTSMKTIINTIRFDVNTPHGWEELPIMEGGILYSGAPRKMWAVSMPLLEDAIRDNIFNNDAVSGWILLDYPKDVDVKPDWNAMRSYLPTDDPEVGDVMEISSGYWPWSRVSDMLPQFRARILDTQGRTCTAFFQIPTNSQGYPDLGVQEVVAGRPINLSKTPIKLFKDTWFPMPPN